MMEGMILKLWILILHEPVQLIVNVATDWACTGISPIFYFNGEQYEKQAEKKPQLHQYGIW